MLGYDSIRFFLRLTTFSIVIRKLSLVTLIGNCFFKEGIPILDPCYYSKITKNELENIFRSDINNVEIPLIDERVQNLQEVGRVLLEKYNGS